MAMLLDWSCTTFAETDVLDAKPWLFDGRTWISKCPLLNAVAHMWVSDPPCQMYLIARSFSGLLQDHKPTLENTLLLFSVMEFHYQELL